jgi:hypothetical protein
MVHQLIANQMLWAGGSLAIGFLQAWDSNAFVAGGFPLALIVAGILLPPAAIAASSSRGLAMAALIAGAVLLTWARLISPVPMNTLHLALFVPALYTIVASGRWVPAAGEFKSSKVQSFRSSG